MTSHVTTAKAVEITRLPRWRLWNAVRARLLSSPIKLHHRAVLWDRAEIEAFAKLAENLSKQETPNAVQ